LGFAREIASLGPKAILKKALKKFKFLLKNIDLLQNNPRFTPALPEILIK
jgi:hypothetical protein